MKTCQVTLTKKDFTAADLSKVQAEQPSWITVFGHPSYFEDGSLGQRLKAIFPKAEIIGCSTAGEIGNDGVHDNRLVVTGVNLKRPNIRAAWCEITGAEGSRNSGSQLASSLSKQGLNGVFVLSQGVNVNGSDFIAGIKSQVSSETVITGGLAGDAGAFQKTYVLCNEKVGSNIAAGIGFYDNAVKIGFGSMGGWEPFGPVRRVTKSKANVLYTLDGEPALELYKKYLGDHAKGLPASGLLFPFAILKENGDQTGLIRTILAVDEKEGSLTFAGDMPENSIVRLMSAKTANLVNGASGAAQWALSSMGDGKPQDAFAILVSCVGRKLVMADDIEEEVDAVQAVMQKGTVTGFYSYGEICPFGFVSDCKLHNQTMTVSYYTEMD
ncbi:MAG: hypothetical protein RJB66_629 [Pseudomonadota bacterium]|jgi:hypothetical protein